MLRTVLVLLLLFAYLFPLTSGDTVAAESQIWPTTTPEDQGVDSNKLADAMLAMQAVPDLHSFLLIRNGQMVVDAYFYPYDGSTPHDLASITKSVMTTLIGIAADQGSLSLDQTLVSFFPDRTIANRDARKEAITVAQLASNTSGLDCIWNPGEPTLAEMLESDDWVQFTLDLPMAAEPGSTWEYCSPGMHLLSAILTEATGQTALDFARQNLFGPLGINDVIWPADPQGYTHGWGDLYLHPREAAKLGQLWLNGGTWNGVQVVSREWVTAAASTQAETSNPADNYGYGWWILRESAVGGQFGARGRGGQYIEVFPALNTVAVMTGVGSYASGAALDLFVQAVVDPTTSLPANPEGVARLNDVVAQLSDAPTALPVAPLPDTARTVSGTEYEFSANPAGIESLKLTFDDSAEATIEMTIFDSDTPLIGTAGLDGIYRLLPGEHGFVLGIRGRWVDEQTFEIDFNEIANNRAIYLTLRYENGSVMLDLYDRTRESTFQIQGTATTP